MFSARAGFNSFQYNANAFVFTVDTTLTGSNTSQYQFPATSGSYTINWGDGNTQTLSGTQTHTYASPGTYLIQVTGNLGSINNWDARDAGKITGLINWGNIAWTNMSNAFATCGNMVALFSDYPNLNSVSNTAYMFYETFNFGSLSTSDLNNWNVSNVTNMDRMFKNCYGFAPEVSNWNVSKVTNLSETFGSTNFNSNIANWNVANVTNMMSTFYGTQFNQPIGNWNVGNVTTMRAMFYGAPFNQDITNWNVSKVTDMGIMFAGYPNDPPVPLHPFNQPIGNWNVGNVTVFEGMFTRSEFNQPIGNWNVSKATLMTGMFEDATAFNQDISSWNVANVRYMPAMFRRATAFNQNLGNWTISGLNTGLNDWRMDWMLDDCGMNTENYNKTLIGWANWVSGHANVPSNITLGANGRTYSNTVYTGTPYNRANTARTYLDTGTPNWTFVGDSQV